MVHYTYQRNMSFTPIDHKEIDHSTKSQVFVNKLKTLATKIRAQFYKTYVNTPKLKSTDKQNINQLVCRLIKDLCRSSSVDIIKGYHLMKMQAD